MTTFSPREIVSELDRYIVGQGDAKRAVAIALRNRWRRQQLEGPLKDEVLPKNILMIGPTGVGKTEISRRLAKLAGAPFLKVEATKFTEVGYVGRDVESIIRDLVEVGLALVREARRKEVRAQAEKNAEERVLDALVGPTASPGTRESFRKRLRRRLDDYERNVPPHVRAARIADEFNLQQGRQRQYQNGGWISYLITTAGPEPLEVRRAPIDYDHYVTRQLQPIADAILPFVSDSFSALIDEQLGLF